MTEQPDYGYITETTHTVDATDPNHHNRTVPLTVGTVTHPDKPGMIFRLSLGEQEVWLHDADAMELAKAIEDAAVTIGYNRIIEYREAETIAWLAGTDREEWRP